MTTGKAGRVSNAAKLPLAALAPLLAAIPTPPVHAQESTSPAPPPATGRTIDFRLPPADDGRAPGVQGPADNGLAPLAPGERRGAPTPTPTPAPQPAPPRVVATQPAATQPAPATTRRDARPAPAATPRPAPERAAPSESAPEVQAGDAAPAATVSDTDAVSASPALVGIPPAPAGEGGTPLWAWLLAGLAAAGAGFWYWRRRPALAGPAAAVEPEPAPQPAARAADVPKPAAAPVPTPTPSPLVTRPAPEQRALVSMALEVRAIRILPEQVSFVFALGLLNQGALAATGMMVRIALGQGSAMPEAVLARFFDGAGGSVLRDDMVLAPGASEQLSGEVSLPRAAVEPLMIAGKPMLVPVAAFDVTYHWDGPGEAFGQNAGSFVLGREPAASGGEKLAPLPLDRPSLVIDRPGARATAMRRSQ